MFPCELSGVVSTRSTGETIPKSVFAAVAFACIVLVSARDATADGLVAPQVAKLRSYVVDANEMQYAQYPLRHGLGLGPLSSLDAIRVQAEEIIAAKKLRAEGQVRKESADAQGFIRHKILTGELSAWLDVQELKALERLNANSALLEQRARERYELNRSKAENQYPSKANLTILFIDTTARGFDGAVARVSELRARMAKGEAFDELAKTETDDASVKTGQTPHTFDIYKPQAEQAVATQVFEKMRAGELVGPLPVSSGWIFVRLNTLTPPTPVPFADVRERLMNEVRQSVIKTARQDAYDKLMPQRVELLPDPNAAKAPPPPDIEAIRKILTQQPANSNPSAAKPAP